MKGKSKTKRPLFTTITECRSGFSQYCKYLSPSTKERISRKEGGKEDRREKQRGEGGGRVEEKGRTLKRNVSTNVLARDNIKGFPWPKLG